MASSINSTSAGNGGLVSTGDDSGILNIQTNETTAITVDASQRVSFVAGTAALPAITTAGDTNTGIYFPAADTIAFSEGGTEAMRIDSSGNLLVGTTDSGSGATAAKLRIIGSSANNLFVGSATAGGWRITSDALNDGGTYYHIKFTDNGTQHGSITSNGTNTSYTTSSDYRLKENIAPMTGALNKVAQLNPVTYKWKSNGSDGEGFIAHELAEIVPNAVIGDKDAVDADGNPVYQGIDVSFLVATLTAALQETKTLIDTQAETINALTARIVALEGQ